LSNMRRNLRLSDVLYKGSFMFMEERVFA